MTRVRRLGLAFALAAVWTVRVYGEERQPPLITDVPEGARRQEIVAAFQQGLSRIGSAAEVHGCGIVVSYVQPPAGHDSSWGAICTVSTKTAEQLVLACDDRLVGEFALTLSFTISRKAVADFVLRNCP